MYSLPAMQETWVRSLGWEDPLEKGKAIHSSILVRRIPWTKESQRVRHNWVTFTFTGIFSPNHLSHTAFHKHCWNSGIYSTHGQIRSMDLRGRAHRSLLGGDATHWKVEEALDGARAARGERDDARVISEVGHTGFSAD